MYESPIRLIVQQLEEYLREQQDKQIFAAIQKCGVDVDRDEFIKALAYDRDQYEKGYADGRADAMPRWISVEERLPETREGVLVIGKFVPEGGWFVPHIAEFYRDSWRLDDDEYSYPEDRPIKVTHWMPLPEPPKEE